MGRKRVTDDSEWKEADINTHAVFMGYLSMAVRGLGFLVVTWTTVVLLGGFVSTLKRKDFWCLTMIILVETAGAFDIFLKEKLSNIWYACIGLLTTGFAKVRVPTGTIYDRVMISCGVICCPICCPLCVLLGVVYMLVCALIVIPLVGLYMYGLYVSTAISLWRLIQRDYGNTDAESNMRPALDVLYSLALLQGVVFAYRANNSSAGKKIAKEVADEYELDDQERPLILEYMQDTMAGCEKDPTFARGRNLITYAVQLMESRSPDSFLSGVGILDALIRSQSSSSLVFGQDHEQYTMIKHMIDPASPSHALHKLLQTLDSRSTNRREMRERAARIVAYLASNIRLEQFPQGIEYISCLIVSTFEDYRQLEPYERDWLLEKCGQDWVQQAHLLPSNEDNFSKNLWEEYEGLFLQGQRILGKLAANESNCRFMGDAQGLLSKIMAPLTSDLLHNSNNHSTWYKVVDGSLQVMHQLVSAPGETGTKLRRQISSSREATSTMERILTCTTCETDLQQRAMEIITRLDIIDTPSTQGFIKKLVDIFTGGNKKDDTTRLAADEAKLSPEDQKKKDDTTRLAADEAELSPEAQEKKDDTTRLATSEEKLSPKHQERKDDTTRLAADEAKLSPEAQEKEDDTRRLAGEALAKLCFQGGSNIATIILRVHDDVVTSLSEILYKDAGVLNISRISAAEILQHLCLHYTSNDDCLQKLKEAMTDVMPKLLRAILPREQATQGGSAVTGRQQHGDASQDDRRKKTYSSRKKAHEGRQNSKLRSALLSLCLTVFDTFIGGDPDQQVRLSATAAFTGLPGKLKIMVERHSKPTVESLTWLKLTSKMVLSVTKHGGISYFKQEDLDSLMKALEIASEIMDPIDNSMYFAITNNGTMTTSPSRSLSSLVKEAKKTVATTYNEPQELELIDPSTLFSNGNPE